MGTVDLLGLAKLGGMNAKQKSELKKRLNERKRNLKAAMKSVDQGLKVLAKGTAKRRTARRAKR